MDSTTFLRQRFAKFTHRYGIPHHNRNWIMYQRNMFRANGSTQRSYIRWCRFLDKYKDF